MSASIFERQESIDLTVPNHVALIGCGGVGSWIGFLLALAGVPRLTLFDSDRVSNSNLNRAPYGPQMLDHPKTEALAALIATVRPDCKVSCWPNFNTDLGKAIFEGEQLDVAVATTDTHKSRVEAYKYFSDFCAYIEAAAEGEVGSIATAPAEFITADEESPGYAHVPVWVGPAVAAAYMATSYILHAADVPESARLGWHDDDISFAFREE